MVKSLEVNARFASGLVLGLGVFGDMKPAHVNVYDEVFRNVVAGGIQNLCCDDLAFNTVAAVKSGGSPRLGPRTSSSIVMWCK